MNIKQSVSAFDSIYSTLNNDEEANNNNKKIARPACHNNDLSSLVKLVLGACTIGIIIIYFFSNNYNTSNTTSNDNSLLSNENKYAKGKLNDQRVVFLAGPHKTGSTSVQENILEWSEKGLLGNWMWAAPNDTQGVFSMLPGGKGKKVFAPLINVLANRTEISRNVPREEEDRKEMLEEYRRAFQDAWRNGRDIVFGAEGGDNAANHKIQPDVFIHGLLNMMPWAEDEDAQVEKQTSERKDESSIAKQRLPSLHGSNANVTIVVTYRAPRVDHYVSAWHMFGNPPKLREWTIDNTKDMHLLDPLGVAEQYANYGLSVVIVDLSGIVRKGADLSNVVACDILQVPCVGYEIIGEDAPPKFLNHMTGNRTLHELINRDMTKEELSRIDDLIKRFDCNYLHLTKHPKVQILHGKLLFDNFLECPHDAPHITRDELLEQIKDVARDGQGHVKIKWNTTFHPAHAYYVDTREPSP